MAKGLIFSDMIRLSWANIAQHKSRSIAITLSISALFGMIMGIYFILAGLETTLLEVSSQKTDGKFYVITYLQTNNGTSPITNTNERLQKSHGEIIGTLTEYSFNPNADLPFVNFPLKVISQSASNDFLTITPAEVPAGRIPILSPANGYSIVDEDDQFDWLREQIDNKYYTIGHLPTMSESGSHIWAVTEPGYSNDHTPTIPGGFNPLNLILGKIYPGMTSDTQPLLIDDTSGITSTYVNSLIDDYVQAQPIDPEGWNNIKPPKQSEYTIVRFNTAQDLINYTAPTIETFFNDSYPQLIITDLVGNASNITTVFHQTYLQYFAISAIVLIVAILIAIFTFSQLIDQDAPIIALYRSMGASTKDINMIYLLYLLELCLCAVVASIIIGLAISGCIFLLNAAPLAGRLQDFYLLDAKPKVSFVGINQNFLYLLIAILITAPLTLLFTQKHLSAGYIAKRLKSE